MIQWSDHLETFLRYESFCKRVDLGQIGRRRRTHMLAYAENRAVARRAVREEDRKQRSERIRQGYEKAMVKFPKIIANLAK